MKSISAFIAAVILMVTTFGMHVSNSKSSSKLLTRSSEMIERREL